VKEVGWVMRQERWHEKHCCLWGRIVTITGRVVVVAAVRESKCASPVTAGVQKEGVSQESGVLRFRCERDMCEECRNSQRTCALVAKWRTWSTSKVAADVLGGVCSSCTLAATQGLRLNS
jgi:hypothetical protein